MKILYSKSIEDNMIYISYPRVETKLSPGDIAIDQAFIGRLIIIWKLISSDNILKVNRSIFLLENITKEEIEGTIRILKISYNSPYEILYTISESADKISDLMVYMLGIIGFLELYSGMNNRIDNRIAKFIAGIAKVDMDKYMLEKVIKNLKSIIKQKANTRLTDPDIKISEKYKSITKSDKDIFLE